MGERRMGWQDLARLLGERMANHAYCDEHTLARADVDGCPYCRDRWAYNEYARKAGGRPEPSGASVSIWVLRDEADR